MTNTVHSTICVFFCRPCWPRGLRRGFAAAFLLRLRVRISPGHGRLSVVSVVFCQVEVSARTDHSFRGVLPNVVCLNVF
jgi:hypothetical protein